jgi:hypothetical protein
MPISTLVTPIRPQSLVRSGALIKSFSGEGAVASDLNNVRRTIMNCGI